MQNILEPNWAERRKLKARQRQQLRKERRATKRSLRETWMKGDQPAKEAQ